MALKIAPAPLNTAIHDEPVRTGRSDTGRPGAATQESAPSAPKFGVPWQQYFNGLDQAVRAPAAVVAAPLHNNSAGIQGQIALDANFLYGCVAKNVWKGVAWTLVNF